MRITLPGFLAGIGIGRLLLGALGLIGIGFGAVVFFVLAGSFRAVLSGGLWLLVPPVVSDLLIMPIAAGAGWLIARLLPAPWRAPVTVAIALSVLVLLIGWPFISGLGVHPDNASLLNRDYPLGALVALGVIWLCCLGYAVVRWLQGRRAAAAGQPGPAPPVPLGQAGVNS